MTIGQHRFDPAPGAVCHGRPSLEPMTVTTGPRPDSPHPAELNRLALVRLNGHDSRSPDQCGVPASWTASAGVGIADPAGPHSYHANSDGRVLPQPSLNLAVLQLGCIRAHAVHALDHGRLCRHRIKTQRGRSEAVNRRPERSAVLRGCPPSVSATEQAQGRGPISLDHDQCSDGRQVGI